MEPEERMARLNARIETLERAIEAGDETRLTMLRLNSLKVLRYKLRGESRK